MGPARRVSVACRQGYRQEPLHAVHREFPEWTRQRVGSAVAKPENAQLAALQVFTRWYGFSLTFPDTEVYEGL